ncbi:MAG: hypothetical protein JWM00_809 [Candidatus Saccharibacteria bacterium]|nr:hypothetical protein [Candidatus Saccharibacteria bacterium]
MLILHELECGVHADHRRLVFCQYPQIHTMVTKLENDAIGSISYLSSLNRVSESKSTINKDLHTPNCSGTLESKLRRHKIMIVITTCDFFNKCR